MADANCFHQGLISDCLFPPCNQISNRPLMSSKCLCHFFFIYCLRKLNLNIRHAEALPSFSPSFFAENAVQGLTGAKLGWLECTRVRQKDDFGYVPWGGCCWRIIPSHLHSAGFSVAERLHTMTSNKKSYNCAPLPNHSQAFCQSLYLINYFNVSHWLIVNSSLINDFKKKKNKLYLL